MSLGREVEHFSSPIGVCFDWSYTHMGLHFLLKGQYTDCGYTSVSWPTTKITMPRDKLEVCVHCLMSMNHAFFNFFAQK